MLCNWSPLVSSIARCSRSTFGRPSNARGFFNRSSWRTKADPSRSIWDEPEPLPQPETMDMSAAAMARASAQAIRQCLQLRDGLRDCYFIINSIRHSNFVAQGEMLARMHGLRMQVEEFGEIAIKFGKPVPMQLCYHTLLHALMRSGMTKKAYRLANGMLHRGVPIHTKTLEMLIQMLQSQSALSQILHDPPTTIFKIHPTILSPWLGGNAAANCAIRILLNTRFHHQQRSQTMWLTLLAFAIANGHLILGSLLYAEMIKDWREYVDKTPSVPQSPEPESDIIREPGSFHIPQHPFYRETFKLQKSMVDLIISIDKILSVDDADEKVRQRALQALANLATLLDTGQIPSVHISSLLKSLAQCPQVDDQVWILEKGVQKQIRAYTYFHSVLERKITTRAFIRGDGCRSDLDLKSFNTLMHYALTQRLSPALASKLVPNAPGPPDIAFYNILIRAGTRLRRPDITERALYCLKHAEDNDDGLIATLMRNYIPVQSSLQANKLPQYARGLIEPAPFIALPRPGRGDLVPNNHTILAILVHFIATGQPDLIPDIVFHLIPELNLIDHPTWAPRTHQVSPMEEHRVEGLRRAVSYGPMFFTAVLTALGKIGMTGLAERVWLLAKAAETASRDPNIAGKQACWMLPVHAYTSMLQVYVKEARKSPYQRKPDSFKSSWKPRERRFVVGWAKLVLKQNGQAVRHTTAKELGVQVYWEMTRAIESVYMSLSSAGPGALKRDARFFNAVLRLLATDPIRYPGRREYMRSHWTRVFTRRQREFIKTGRRHSNRWLEMIKQDMREAGFEIPVALKHLFMGGSTVDRPVSRRPVLVRKPYAFPAIDNKPRRQSRFFLPTSKTRGLPLRHNSKGTRL
ncbi:hypothetical protein C8J56DRAFT_1162726 [Mycena floridula]|nr:hypothetical protein C8J56DRAFT_1162726 [Mycena floridula]